MTEPVNAKRRSIQAEGQDLERSLRDVIQKSGNVKQRCDFLLPSTHSHTDRMSLASLAALTRVQDQRENELSIYNMPAYNALKWLRANKGQFKGVVYEPIRLLVSAKDSKLADLAEAPISIAQADVSLIPIAARCEVLTF